MASDIYIKWFQSINQPMDLYDGAINSKSDNDDDDREAQDAAMVNQRRVETYVPLVGA